MTIRILRIEHAKIRVFFLKMRIYMTADELKIGLAALGWNQKDFAKRYTCDEDTVSRWCTGKTAVPGHVKEYIRVMLLAKEILG